MRDNIIHCRNFKLDQAINQSEILNTVAFSNSEQYIYRFNVTQNELGAYHIFYIGYSSGGNKKAFHFYFDGTGEYFHQRISSLVMDLGYDLVGVDNNDSLTAYFYYEDNQTYKNQADYSDLIADLADKPTILPSESDLDFEMRMSAIRSIRLSQFPMPETAI